MTYLKVTGEGTTWINLIDPTPIDIEGLRRTLPFIHPLNLEDLLSATERPKIDVQTDYLYITLHFPLWDVNNRISRPYEIDFIVGKNVLVTAHDGRLNMLMNLFDGCRDEADVRGQMLQGTPGHAFYMILDKLVDHLFPMLRKVDGNLRAIENNIFTTDGQRIIQDVAVLRRDIISLRRIIRQQLPIVEQMAKMDNAILRGGMEHYFDDIVDHLNRARDIIDEDAEVVASLSDTADKLLSHRINGVIRILTVFSAIMLPLTFISSVYGMNLINLPLAEHPNSFWILSGGMLLLAVGMLLFFRWRKWL
ncbi:MAG: magnesium transporter CorA family protein [Chloroflexota bacterium]|nr:magnesium transporter CorA family protein [Chloroflexota bacterium]